MPRIYTVAKWRRQLLGCPLQSRAVVPAKSPSFWVIPKTSDSISLLFRTPSLVSPAAGENTANTPVPSKETRKKTLSHKNLEEDDDVDEDAFEALFSQLEEDLKNDGLIGEDDEDDFYFLSEEELAKLEHGLAEALEEDELLGALCSMAYGDNNNEDVEEESDNVDDDEAGDEEEKSPIKLKNWPSRRLA